LRSISALLVLWLAQGAWAALKPATVQAFEAYVRGVEARTEPRAGTHFLWLDGAPERLKQARAGEVLAEPYGGKAETDVPSGLIHDWVGGVFIPGTTLEKTLALVQDYGNHKNIYKPEVIDSRLVSRQGGNFKIYLRLLKKKVITVVLNTNHDVNYIQVDPNRWRSVSHSTRIAEVSDAGKPGEKELPVGEGQGFLWRLYSYWRFEQRDGGVYVECEAVSLTRNVPTGLGWLIEPIIRNLPRESLANTLRATRDALRR